MPITIITASIPLRDPALEWDQLGPGRYPGEVVVELASGEKIAVSVDPKWLENGAGVSLDGNARWIEGDGRTKLSAEGAHVESNLMATASLGDVREFGLKPLARDIALILAGEEPRLLRPANAALSVAARPVFALDHHTRAGVSIKNAADVVKASTGFSLSLA